MRDLLSKLDAIVSETALKDKADLEAKRKALQDLQKDPVASSDPEIKQAIIQRKADLEKEAKAKGFDEETDENIYQIGDDFGISFNEEFEIGTEVVDILEDGIVIELDETAIGYLSQNGFTFEEVQLDEDKKKGVDGKACWKGYRYAGKEQKSDGSYKDKCVKVKEDRDDDEPLTFSPGTNAHMTSLQGKILTSYSELVDIFGEPQFGPDDRTGDKVTCEWIIDFSDGTVATIYDWKEQETPMHKTQWHVGGKSREAYWNVLEVIDRYKEDQKIEDPRDYAEKSADLDASHYGQRETLELEAKYQGREVTLNKPMAGDVKKSKVYVKGPKGNVVKVNFGDKKMRIKKSNPNRRKSFRARHNCKNPGPKWKARYWSCRAW